MLEITLVYMGKPRNTQKYPEIPESKKDTRKYPIVYIDTPTEPELDPLPGILSNTWPDPILKKPTRWPLYITLYIQPKKQFEIQIIGILDVIGSFI